jgi:hypothetical protein
VWEYRVQIVITQPCRFYCLALRWMVEGLWSKVESVRNGLTMHLRMGDVVGESVGLRWTRDKVEFSERQE